MTKEKRLLKMNIQLFSDGGTAGDGSGSGEGVTATDAMSQEGVNVQVAAEQQEGTTQTAELTPEQLEAEYEEAIKGKYKAIHQKKMSKLVSSRVNEFKPTVEKYNRSQSVLQKLAQRYGVENAEDFDALESALDDDDPNLEAEALERDIPLEQLKQMKKVEREYQQLKSQDEKRKRDEAINRQMQAWKEEAKQVKEIYPDFDLGSESQSQDFNQLLASGIPMQKAYEVIHFEELMTRGMQTAQKEAEKKIANAVASNSKRVVENGVSGNAAVVHTDVSRMTREQIDDINSRVLRGERVVL